MFLIERLFGKTGAGRAIPTVFAVILAVCAGAILASPAGGQAGLQVRGAPNKGADPVVGRGDLIEVRVFDTPELSGSYRISGDGELDLPLIGQLQAGGVSASALAGQIASLYTSKGLVLHPQVTVRITEFATQGVTVGGEVLHPGIYPLYGQRSLAEVMAMAGGLTPQADTRVRIHHRSLETEETVQLSFEDLNSTKAQNTAIFPGDSVSVPRAGIVYVLGEVTRPGGIVMRNSGHLTLLEAVAEAQGTKYTASLQSSFLLRKRDETYSRIKIPLKDYVNGHNGDMELMAGDVLVVPASGTKLFFSQTSGVLAALGGASLYAAAH